LLVISTESVADNRALGLRSPVLLDQEGLGVGRLFGATGTPMAVLVDEAGRIASETMAAAPAVLALAGTSEMEGSTGGNVALPVGSLEEVVKGAAPSRKIFGIGLSRTG